MDYITQPLKNLLDQLKQLDIKYTIHTTRPVKSCRLEDDCFYVIRQHIDADGTYHWVVAAKMGKEVC